MPLLSGSASQKKLSLKGGDSTAAWCKEKSSDPGGVSDAQSPPWTRAKKVKDVGTCVHPGPRWEDTPMVHPSREGGLCFTLMVRRAIGLTLLRCSRKWRETWSADGTAAVLPGGPDLSLHQVSQ